MGITNHDYTVYKHLIVQENNFCLHMKNCLPYDCVQTHDQNLYQVAECTCGQISVAEYNPSSIKRLDEKTRSTSNIFLSRLQINPKICHNHFLSAIQKYSRLCNVLELFLVIDFYIMTKLLWYKKNSMMFFGQNVNPLTNEEIFFGLKMEFVVKKQT